MKKILLSLGSILFVSALLAGGTGAYLASSSESTGNTFANGVIDLKIDNESYVTSTTTGKLIFNPGTSWGEVASLVGKYFFKFTDLKPGDIGEDTISIHVNNNNAWVCMNIKLKATPENGVNEPEAIVDHSTGPNQGELQKYLYFVFWADDGDNVFEKGEKIFKAGLAKDIFNGKWWPVADSKTNVWGQGGSYNDHGWYGDDEHDWNKKSKDKGYPVPGGSIKYVGKAWCFGTLVKKPVYQDGKGKLPGSTNGPLVRGTGFTCDGEPVGNIAQSDGIRVDVSFAVTQSRNNDNYKCGVLKDPHGDDDDYGHDDDDDHDGYHGPYSYGH